MEQIYRIGNDHGYGNIKTAHHIFESGIIQMDKVWDEDYYILTLAALAKELIEGQPDPVRRISKCLITENWQWRLGRNR